LKGHGTFPVEDVGWVRHSDMKGHGFSGGIKSVIRCGLDLKGHGFSRGIKPAIRCRESQVLKGHGFSRAIRHPSKGGALAPEGKQLQIGFVLCALLMVLLSACDLHAQATEQIEQGKIIISGAGFSYRIRMLPLASFPTLPAPIAQELSQRECEIPQTYQAKRPENLIHGSFSGKGSEDWAVLCSHDHISTLLVFFAASPGTPTTLITKKNEDMLSCGDFAPTCAFAWALDAIPAARIHSFDLHRGNYDHDGIEESVVAHGSYLHPLRYSPSVHYFKDSAWIAIQGVED
jgi:hypothetical protein